MKQKKLISLISLCTILAFIFSILFYPSLSYAQSQSQKLNVTETVKEKTNQEEDGFVVLDAKTGEVVDEITPDELAVKSRSITINHTETT